MPNTQPDAPMDQVAAPPLELLSFSVAGQDYAVDIMSVREIRNWTEPTPLPRTPDYVRGVINLRGTVLPILDLARRLDLPASDIGERAVYVVLKTQDRIFGIVVDAVSDILTVPMAALQDPPTLFDGDGESCVSKLILEEDRMIRILTVEDLAPRPNSARSETTISARTPDRPAA